MIEVVLYKDSHLVWAGKTHFDFVFHLPAPIFLWLSRHPIAAHSGTALQRAHTGNLIQYDLVDTILVYFTHAVP